MILPHIGLVLLLGVYTVCGAFIFHVIELPHEEEVSSSVRTVCCNSQKSIHSKVRSNALRRIKVTKDSIVEILWNVSMDADYDEYDWKFIATQKIQELEKVVWQISFYQFNLSQSPRFCMTHIKMNTSTCLT